MKKFIAIVALMGALNFSNHATAGVRGGFRSGHFGHTVFFTAVILIIMDTPAARLARRILPIVTMDPGASMAVTIRGS